MKMLTREEIEADIQKRANGSGGGVTMPQSGTTPMLSREEILSSLQRRASGNTGTASPIKEAYRAHSAEVEEEASKRRVLYKTQELAFAGLRATLGSLQRAQSGQTVQMTAEEAGQKYKENQAKIAELDKTVRMGAGKVHTPEVEAQLDALEQEQNELAQYIRQLEDADAMQHDSAYWAKKASHEQARLQEANAYRSGYGSVMQSGILPDTEKEQNAEAIQREYDKALEYYYAAKNAEDWSRMTPELREKAMEAAALDVNGLFDWQKGDTLSRSGLSPDQRAAQSKDEAFRLAQLRQEISDAGFDADRILDYANRLRNQQRMQETAEEMTDFASGSTAGAIAATAASYGSNLLSGIGSVGILAQRIFGSGSGVTDYRPVDYNAPSTIFSQVTSATRGAVSAQMGETGQFFYGTLNSAVDSAARMLVAKAIGTGFLPDSAGQAAVDRVNRIVSGAVSAQMSTQVFTDAFLAAKQSGATDDDAILDALVQASIEGITEKYSVDSILKNPNNLVLTALRNNFIAEGSEEIASDFLNTIYDELKNGSDSELRSAAQKYIDAGLDPKEAWKLVLSSYAKQVVLDGLAGGISGIAMGGAAELADYTQRLQAYTQKGQQILDSGNYDMLQALAMDVAKEGVYGKGESELSILAEKTAAGVKNLNENRDSLTQRQVNRATRNVGKLADRVDTVRQQQNAADIQAMLEKKGMSARDAKKAAQLISENYEGMVDPEDKDLQRVMAKPEVRETMKEIADDPNSSVRQRNYRYNLGLMGLKLDENGVVVPVRSKKEEPSAESVTTAEADKNASVEISDGVSGKMQGIKWDNGILTATVTTEAGETVSAPVEDVSMPIEMQDLVAVSKQFGESAPAVYAAYQPGMGVAEYGAAMKLASDYGYTGVSRSYADSSEYLNGLHPAQISIAYEAGQAAWTKESTETMRSQSNGTVFANRKAGKVSMKGGTVDGVTYKAVDRSGMTAQQKAAVRNITRLAQVTGINFVFYQSEKNSEGKYSGANGIYTDNTIFLDINAGATDSVTEAAILRTAAHELTHFIEQFSKSEYRGLQEFMLKNLDGYKGKTIDQLVAEKQARSKKDMSFQDAMSEIVADGCEMMLQDTRIMDLLASEHEGIAKKISRWLKNWVEDLKAAFTGVEAVHEEAKAMIAHAEELQKLWDNALMQALRNREQNADTSNESGTKDSGENYTSSDRDLESELADAGIKYSERVTDEDTLSFLNGQKTITTYKTMQLVDGKLYPPMASRINGKFEDYSEIGVWEQATEHPELIMENGKFKLDKGKGNGSIKAAYNPYMHSSNLVINDQFKGAYRRDNLVTVECVVPVSEATSGYHAKYAKNSVGWHAWHAGTVAGAIRKEKGVGRKVFLSRWIKPVRIVPDSEVAAMYKDLLDGTDIAVPDNVVTPSLLKELKKAGVKIEESGRVKYSVREFDSSKEKIEKNTTDLAKMTSVYAVHESKLERTGKRPTDIFADYFDRWGNNIYSDELGDIALRKSSIKSEIRHGVTAEKIASIEAIPSVIKDGKVIFAGTKEGSDVQRIVVCAPITIGKNSYYMGVMLQRDTQNQRLYLHNVAIEKEASDISQADLLTTGADENTEYLFITNILQNALAVKYKMQEGNMSWSDRDPDSVSNRYQDRDYSYEALTSKPDMNVTLVDDKAPKNRADVVAQAKKNAAKIGRFDPKTGSVSVHVNDISGDVLLGTDGLKHGLRRTKDAQRDPSFIVTIKAGEIIQNSIRINEATPKKETATGAYVLIGAAQNKDGDLFIVRSMVNQFSNELDSIDVLYSINTKKELAATKSPRSAATPLSVTSSTISISDLLDYVNKYFPDILPEEVLKHYGYSRRPEGDLGDDILFQDRDPDQISNRALLANALDSAVKNDIERKRLEEYRGKIDLLNSEEQKLQGLRSEIRELSFAKGPKDTKRIRELQFEANKTANRINIIDRQLLRLEAAAPLQNVLQREKKMAYKRAEQKGKEALAAYREKATKTQREIISRYQESRAKGIDSRKRTAMRHKIQNVVNELNDLLLNESKKRHVPDSLKKAVADALALVNMDTVGAEERIAKLEQEMLKAKTPEKIQEISRRIDNIRDMGDKIGQRLKDLRDAYEEISGSDDPDIANAYDHVIAGNLKELASSIGNTSLRNMSIEQLSDVYDMYRMVLIRVRDANKSFLNEKKESISDLASKVVKEVKMVGGNHKYRAAALDSARTFVWNNMKPVYAFEHIGSQTLTEAFKNVRKGEDVWAVDVTEAREYFQDKSRKYHYDAWDFNKQYTFTSTSGMDFRLNLEQILSLYAYSKRDQAHDHLRLGGFVFDSNIDTYKDESRKLIKYKVNTADAHQISTEILANIISKLTPEQKSFVDEMQDYLATNMGAKGNEVTMQMYGVKLFKEKFYFPLKSAKQFMFEQNEVSGEVKIKNSGFTNKTVDKANNPIILSNFMDVWAGHVNDMAMYHAFALPLEDFNRIFNYESKKKEGQPPVSVKGTIQNAYTPAAVSYVKQLITDLNGGARSDPRESAGKALVGRFKKAAVFASASVVIQQPSAIGRALALIDPKYFDLNPKLIQHKKLWAEVKKYAPVAIIKEMGYFDTDMGMSTVDYIKGEKNFMDKMDDVLSWAPAMADELTWCHIWTAVKRETQAKNPGLSIRSEEFLQKAGARFTEVIVKTQVYDSVLSRSANMRSKKLYMNMITSFMAEPTTSINMLQSAMLDLKRGYKGKAAKTIGAVVASVVLNSILVSFVYAGRDDDEDETWLEKYASSLATELVEGINPITYIPIAKDIWSLLQGYDVERADMTLFSSVTKSLTKLVKAVSVDTSDMDEEDLADHRKQVVDASWGLVAAVMSMTGIPVKNVRRDVMAAINTYKTVNNGLSNNKTSFWNDIAESVKKSLPVLGWLPDNQKSDKLYDAIVSGDTAYQERVEALYDDDKAIQNAIRKGLRENDPRIREAAIAWNANDLDEYMRIAKAIINEGRFVQDDVVLAIRAEASKLEEDGSESSSTSKAKGLFTSEKFSEAISQGDEAMANTIKTDIIQTEQKNGKTYEEAEKSFNSSASRSCKELFLEGEISEDKAINALVDYCGLEQDEAEKRVGEWAFEADYGFSYDEKRTQFMEGNITAAELKSSLMDTGGKTEEEAESTIVDYIRDGYAESYFTRSEAASMMVSYGGLTQSEAESKLRYVDTKAQFPDTYVDDAWVDEYYAEVEASGVSLEIFVDYRSQVKSITGEGKKERRMAVINSLPISSAQKDALYFAEGWAASTIGEAPWH